MAPAMSLPGKIDQWIGSTLFVPPIVRLCQLTKQGQFAVARLFWLNDVHRRLRAQRRSPADALARTNGDQHQVS